MKRYSIMVFASDRTSELCQVDGRPEDIVKAAREKTKRIEISLDGATKLVEMPRYARVWYVENLTAARGGGAELEEARADFCDGEKRQGAGSTNTHNHGVNDWCPMAS
jgi:hypothetical protein